MLGGPRALLMQIAHPSVAAGVAAHSDFPAEPFARLWRTLDAMLSISFGDDRQCRGAAARVDEIHRRVHGRTESGEPYSATDPDLLQWVHATLVDSGLVAYRGFFGRLSDRDAEAYHREMQRLAVLMGVPADILPPDLAAFTEYVDRTTAGLDVSEEARRLAPWIVRPPLSPALWPVARFQELVTVGLLPEPLRRAYGLRWSEGRARLLGASGAAARALVPRLPALIRRWPHARAAERRAAVAA
jgi:uncharacterized protein (DUF2236 family)